MRARLALLLLAVFVALSGLLTWSYARDRDSRLAAARATLLADARLIAAHHQVLVARGDATLNGFILRRELQPDAPGAACSRRLAELRSREDAYLQIGATLPDGDVYCSAVPAGAALNLHDRAWFQQTLKSRDAVVGDVIVSRVLGKPTITISKAEWSSDGKVVAVFYLGLGLDWMAREVAQTPLKNGVRLNIVDSRGVLSARFPDPEGLVGKNISHTVIIDRVLAADGDGTFEETNSLGERRLIAHVVLLNTADGSHHHLILSTLKQDVAGPAQRDALIGLGVLLAVLAGAMAAVVVGGNRLLLQPVVTLARTAARLRDGELGARSGLAHGGDEIGQLAQSLDESAAALEDRERALRAAKAKLDAALDSMSEAVFICDVDGRFVEFNESFATFHKFADKQECAQTFDAYPDILDVTFADGTPVLVSQWAVPRALRGETATNVEWGLRRKDTDETWFGSYNFAPLRGPDGAIVGAVVSGRDITDRKRTEAQLAMHRERLEELVVERTSALAVARDSAEAANRSKSAFLANMSHEIRTPMNAILGLTFLMARDNHDPSTGERLGKVAVAANHLLQVINDILDLSKIDAGKMVLEAADFSVDMLFSRAFEMVGAQARAKGLELLLDSDGLPSRLHGDATRVLQALLNLLSNAVKYTSSGWVRLRCELLAEDARRQHIRFEVQDTGEGIAAEHQAGLFNAFQQADNSATRQHGGTGLGLALTRHIAGMMDGETGMRSAPGEGSTFWFTAWLGKVASPEDPAHVPARPDDALPAASSLHQGVARLRLAHAGKRLLLAEDNPINQEVAQALLDATGLVVETADNGAQAVALALSRPYDLILMDVQMPLMDGLAATRAIRAGLGPAPPIVAMTANAFAEERAACLEAGMDDHLAKPVDPELLYATLQRWLAPRPQPSTDP